MISAQACGWISPVRTEHSGIRLVMGRCVDLACVHSNMTRSRTPYCHIPVGHCLTEMSSPGSGI